MSDTEIYDKVKAQTKTQTKDLGELFEYNISNPVTIKRKQSALVPILTESIQAKRVLLYNLQDHDKNPNAWHKTRSPSEAVNPKFNLKAIPTFYFFNRNNEFLGIIEENPKKTIEEDTLEIIKEGL